MKYKSKEDYKREITSALKTENHYLVFVPPGLHYYTIFYSVRTELEKDGYLFVEKNKLSTLYEISKK